MDLKLFSLGKPKYVTVQYDNSVAQHILFIKHYHLKSYSFYVKDVAAITISNKKFFDYF